MEGLCERNQVTPSQTPTPVLHLEDQEDWQRIVQLSLATLPSVVYQAVHGDLDDLCQRVASLNCPVVVVIDLRLQDAGSEFLTVKYMLDHGPQIFPAGTEVLVLSGFVSADTRDSLIRVGVRPDNIFEKDLRLFEHFVVAVRAADARLRRSAIARGGSPDDPQCDFEIQWPTMTRSSGLLVAASGTAHDILLRLTAYGSLEPMLVGEAIEIFINGVGFRADPQHTTLPTPEASKTFSASVTLNIAWAPGMDQAHMLSVFLYHRGALMALIDERILVS